jgi:hypothetical protein
MSNIEFEDQQYINIMPIAQTHTKNKVLMIVIIIVCLVVAGYLFIRTNDPFAPEPTPSKTTNELILRAEQQQNEVSE